jgi:hypothetical protein
MPDSGQWRSALCYVEEFFRFLSPVISFTGSTPRPFARRGAPRALVSIVDHCVLPALWHMPLKASRVDSERRFAAQTPHRPSQSLQSNQIAHQQYPLSSDHPFPAHSHSSSNSMIGPTAPAAPYDPNVYPSYPPAERHQQDYEHFIMTQLSAPSTNPSGLSAAAAAAAGSTMARPPQAVYSDNIIDRMVQRDPYANPYAAPSSTSPQAILGTGGYLVHNQNLYAATGGSSYANATTAYPGAQAPGVMYTWSEPGLLSPDSIHSIESPPVVTQQGPTRSHTAPFYPAVNRSTTSPETEVPFSQIVARNNSTSPQSGWTASGSPTNPNYRHPEHFTTANGNGVMVAQQMQAVRAITTKNLKDELIFRRAPLRCNSMPSRNLKACSHASPMAEFSNRTHAPPPLRLQAHKPSRNQRICLQSMGPVLQTEGFKLTHLSRNISGRKMAAAVSRRDPQQRLTNPSKQLLQPGLPSKDAGKRTGSTASATSQGGGSNKRGRRYSGSDSSEEGAFAATQSARL